MFYDCVKICYNDIHNNYSQYYYIIIHNHLKNKNKKYIAFMWTSPKSKKPVENFNLIIITFPLYITPHNNNY